MFLYFLVCVILSRYRYLKLKFLQPKRCHSLTSKLIAGLKGGVGFSKQGRILVKRVPAQTPYYNNFLYSTRFYTRVLWLTSAFHRILKGSEVLYLTAAFSSRKILTLLPSTTALFSVNFNDHRFIVSSKISSGSSNALLYFKLGNFIKYIRDVFSTNFLWASAPGSLACINYFDKFSGFLSLLLPSGRRRLFFFLSRACAVLPSNTDSNDFLLGENAVLSRSVVRFYGQPRIKGYKAGFMYSFGYRPKVRGVAMNPVDHPHGGRTKSIRLPKTPWGKVTKLK